MQSFLLATTDRCYRTLLKAYPAKFREHYALEMAQVFRSLCMDEYGRAGVTGLVRLWILTTWDGTLAALYQWWMSLSKGRMENMPVKLIDRQDGILPLSPTQAGIAALPFLAFGISSIMDKLEFFHTYPVSWPLWQILLTYPYLVFNWLMLIGLGIGILAGFPRWAYSFLGWALFFGWWWSDMGFYGYSMDLKIWLPFLGVFAIALLIRRSLAPLRALFKGIWHEWTLLALGIYILYSSVYLIADGVHHPYLQIIIAVTTVAFSIGAGGYFLMASPLRRVFTLMGGFILAIMISVFIDLTWDARPYYGLPEDGSTISLAGMIFLIILILLMLGIGLLTLWRHRRDPA